MPTSQVPQGVQGKLGADGVEAMVSRRKRRENLIAARFGQQAAGEVLRTTASFGDAAGAWRCPGGAALAATRAPAAPLIQRRGRPIQRTFLAASSGAASSNDAAEPGETMKKTRERAVALARVAHVVFNAAEIDEAGFGEPRDVRSIEGGACRCVRPILSVKRCNLCFARNLWTVAKRSRSLYALRSTNVVVRTCSAQLCPERFWY